MKIIKQIVIYTLIAFIVSLVVDFFWYENRGFKAVFLDNLETIWIIIIVASAITLVLRPNTSKNELKDNKQREGRD